MMPTSIQELWAWVAVDKDDGCEGVVAYRIGDYWVPLMGADRERMESMRDLAVAASRHSQQTIRLLRFTTRTDVETIEREPS
jgi:hypothetical protein